MINESRISEDEDDPIAKLVENIIETVVLKCRLVELVEKSSQKPTEPTKCTNLNIEAITEQVENINFEETVVSENKGKTILPSPDLLLCLKSQVEEIKECLNYITDKYKPQSNRFSFFFRCSYNSKSADESYLSNCKDGTSQDNCNEAPNEVSGCANKVSDNADENSQMKKRTPVINRFLQLHNAKNSKNNATGSAGHLTYNPKRQIIPPVHYTQNADPRYNLDAEMYGPKPPASYLRKNIYRWCRKDVGESAASELHDTTGTAREDMFLGSGSKQSQNSPIVHANNKVDLRNKLNFLKHNRTVIPLATEPYKKVDATSKRKSPGRKSDCVKYHLVASDTFAFTPTEKNRKYLNEEVRHTGECSLKRKCYAVATPSPRIKGKYECVGIPARNYRTVIPFATECYENVDATLRRKSDCVLTSETYIFKPTGQERKYLNKVAGCKGGCSLERECYEVATKTPRRKEKYEREEEIPVRSCRAATRKRKSSETKFKSDQERKIRNKTCTCCCRCSNRKHRRPVPEIYY